MREARRRMQKLEALLSPPPAPPGPAVLIYRPGETVEAAAERQGIDLSRATTLISIPDNGR